MFEKLLVATLFPPPDYLVLEFSPWLLGHAKKFTTTDPRSDRLDKED